jgi:uncharacterized protein (UPF0276 family)
MSAFPAPGMPAVGIAWSPGIDGFLRSQEGGNVDYIEIPFEQLDHDPTLSGKYGKTPVVLHCASMSVAGFVRPTSSTLAAIEREAANTQTPWIGEHLAFVLAHPYDPDGKDEPINVGYTVCPQLSESTLAQVASNLTWLQSRFPAPIILENIPQYFPVPGSTMNLIEFISELCARTPVGLLLDLAHLYISAKNFGHDPVRVLDGFPLERVVEIHLAGVNEQGGRYWDDHASLPPEAVFELLEIALERARPKALTLEYNWEPSLQPAVLLARMERIRDMAGHRPGVEA